MGPRAAKISSGTEHKGVLRIRHCCRSRHFTLGRHETTKHPAFPIRGPQNWTSQDSLDTSASSSGSFELLGTHAA